MGYLEVAYYEVPFGHVNDNFSKIQKILIITNIVSFHIVPQKSKSDNLACHCDNSRDFLPFFDLFSSC